MITVNGVEIKQFNFSGGEVYTKVDIESLITSKSDYISIRSELQSSDDIMALLMVTDTIKRIGHNPKICLSIPYFPYARQDKISEKGEALSLKVICNLINAQNYDTIIINDVHSDTTKALLNTHVIFIEQHDLVNAIFDKFSIKVDALVSPDFGASKKIYKLASDLDIPVIQANKARDTKGTIIRTEVYCDDLTDKDVLIVDDIADGGRTFIELAKVLQEKNVRSIGLYVTHGIFSKGLEPLFEAGINKIYTTDSFRNGLNHPNLFVLDLQ